LVVVTFTRSAASNIRRKIRQHLQELETFVPKRIYGQYFAWLGVQHCQFPCRAVGFSAAETQIISEPRKQGLIKQSANLWLRENPRLYEMLLEGRGL
jgi:DNA helicase-2/ATP-dependent DNA helicase PcrA